MKDECFYDNGGRRCVWDRREFRYTGCIPDRRSGKDRRSGEDRRRLMREAEDRKAWTCAEAFPIPYI